MDICKRRSVTVIVGFYESDLTECEVWGWVCAGSRLVTSFRSNCGTHNVRGPSVNRPSIAVLLEGPKRVALVGFMVSYRVMFMPFDALIETTTVAAVEVIGVGAQLI